MLHVVLHDWRWVEDGTIEVSWVWTDVLSVGESSVVTGVEMVTATAATSSVPTSWEISLTRVSEVWSVGSEGWVCTITRWVSHDVGVVLAIVEVLEDGRLVSLETVEVLKPVGPVLHSCIHGGTEASALSISSVIEGVKEGTNLISGVSVGEGTSTVELSSLSSISSSLSSLGGFEFITEAIVGGLSISDSLISSSLELSGNSRLGGL